LEGECSAKIVQKDTDFKKLVSKEDLSVNFIANDNHNGFLEARYVRRSDDYFIVYLSSQTGCMKSCRMCHLTATGQNKYLNSTPNDFVEQAKTVLKHYDDQKKSKLVHFNFMSRGEPLDNIHLTNDSSKILQPLSNLAKDRGLDRKFLISTIMPDTIKNLELTSIFNNEELFPEIYYSIYSLNPIFRKKWLPRAIEPMLALEKIKKWQDYSGKIPKIHFAFIENENDKEEDVINMCNVINSFDLKVNFNIVKYNPYNEKYGRESSPEVIQKNVDIMKNILKPERYKIVPKVGFDVKASCGMFIE